MKKNILRGVGIFWLLIAFILLFNASAWAPTPQTGMKMIAHRGVHHIYDPTGVGRDDCTATRLISQPKHAIFENTIHAIRAAVTDQADMVEIDVAPTKDGHMVLFHDWTVDCRTNGKGETRDLTLAELQALDIGYGYTADGGKTYPLRGKGVGKIPTVQDALAAETGKPFLFNFKSKNPQEADQLFTIIKASGRDPIKMGDSFYGGAAPVKRIKELIPGIWAWDKDSVKACTKDYVWMGWFGVTPDSCKDGTLIVPLNYQWAFAGFPNRALDRMNKVGGHVILIGPYKGRMSTRGLTEAKQLNDIPASYGGWVMIEDIRSVGPALLR